MLYIHLNQHNQFDLIDLFLIDQDYFQMKNQSPENKLKSAVLFHHIFKDEDVILWLRSQFSDYKYPDIDVCLDLYNDHNTSGHQDG